MKFKTIALIAMALTVAAALAACAPAAAPAPTATPAPVETPEPTAPEATVETAATEEAAETGGSVALELTIEELAQYNGKDGQPAYVAVDGVIYDVTNVPQWNNGMHNGNEAGKDLTAVIKSAPHGDSVLKNLPVVGSLK